MSDDDAMNEFAGGGGGDGGVDSTAGPKLHGDTGGAAPHGHADGHREANEAVPAGYQLNFTSKGVGYLTRIDGEDTDDSCDSDDEEALNEHRMDKLSMFISLNEIERRFGFGTRIYFNFIKFIVITNLVLTIVTSVHYIAFLGQADLEDGFSADLLYISAYPEELYGVWLAMSIIGILVMLAIPPVYWFYITKRIEKEHFHDHDNEYAFSGMGMDIIKENQHCTSTERFVRRCVSYGVSLLLLVGSCLATYFIQAWGNTKVDVADSFNIWNYLVAGTVSTINVVFQKVAIPLAMFEKHATWGGHRKHMAAKMITFKILNLTAMYAAKAFAFVDSSTPRCGLQDMGSQFLALLLMDAVLFGAIEMITPLVMAWAKKRAGIMQEGSDEDAMPEFDIAEEYLELFYRQFVIYVGMTVFPMITLLGFITNLLEYPQDKFRMLRLSQRPKRLNVSMKRFLVAYLTVIALAGLLAWPLGNVWVLGAAQSDRPQYYCCDILRGDTDGINSTLIADCPNASTIN